MTTITAVTTPWTQQETALRAHHPVAVSYHDRCRLICPHALGWHRGRPMVLGYQSSGQTSTGILPEDPRKRWRCMYVDEIDHVVSTDQASAWHSADNYNPAHPFTTIDEVAIATDLVGLNGNQ